MEQETQIAEIQPKNMYVPICIAQAACIAVIIVSILLIKFFFKNTYTNVQTWCKNNVFDHVKITAFSQEEEIIEN